MIVISILAFILGALIGAGVCYFFISKQNFILKGKITALESQLESIKTSKENLTDTFKALSSESLKNNNESFLTLAKSVLEKYTEQAKGDLDKRQQAIDSMVKPIRETLTEFDNKVQNIEKNRVASYEGLNQLISSLKKETSGLAGALKSPTVSGSWGQMQLRRAVELAGMMEYCDFSEQASVNTPEGRLIPDMVVRLPGNKQVVVDSKAVVDSYLEAVNTDNEQLKNTKLDQHVKHIKARVDDLKKKEYWQQFENSPELVVLFLPGESFFSAALKCDPTLMDQSIEEKVLIATPITLIALLKAVAYGWKQEALEENAKEVSDLGKELYERLAMLSEHFQDLGDSLHTSVDRYNKALGTLENRVLVSGRRFKELKVDNPNKEIKFIEPVDVTVRDMQAEELKR